MDATDLNQLRQALAKHTTAPAGIGRACLGAPDTTVPHPAGGVIFSYCAHSKCGGIYNILTNSWRLFVPFEAAVWAKLVVDTLECEEEAGLDFAR